MDRVSCEMLTLDHETFDLVLESSDLVAEITGVVGGYAALL